MDASLLYSGPQFNRARRRVNIPPNTIRWIRISTYPRVLQEDSVFIAKLNINKSTFFQRKVQFLGVLIDGKQVTVSPVVISSHKSAK